MNVIITIHGREAIPVRALPYVSPSSLDPLSPLRVARDLAEPRDGPFEHESPDVNMRVLTGLQAYLLNDTEESVPILPGRWDSFVADIEAMENDERPFDPSYRDQIDLLPSQVFVWKHEFEEALKDYKSGFRRVSYEPFIQGKMCWVVMEGFKETARLHRTQMRRNEVFPDHAPNINGELPLPATAQSRVRRGVIVSILGWNAIPVRALPFVTGWMFSPDTMAKSLAINGWTRLHAHRLSEDGSVIEMLPKEWDRCVIDMGALSDRLKAEEKFRNERYADWRREAICLLPAGVFVWKAQFELAFHSAYSKSRTARFDEERPGDRELIFDPLIPDELHPAMLEGFTDASRIAKPQSDKDLPGDLDDERPAEELPNDGQVAEMNTMRALAVMVWILAENKTDLRVGARPNASKIAATVEPLAMRAFGEDARGFKAFHKKITEALKLFPDAKPSCLSVIKKTEDQIRN